MLLPPWVPGDRSLATARSGLGVYTAAARWSRAASSAAARGGRRYASTAASRRFARRLGSSTSGPLGYLSLADSQDPLRQMYAEGPPLH